MTRASLERGITTNLMNLHVFSKFRNLIKASNFPKFQHPAKLKKIKAKAETLSAAEKLLNNRREVIDALKTGIFPYIDGFQIKEEESKDDIKKFIEYIKHESKGTNYDLFKDYFNFVVPSVLVKQLYATKDKNKNDKLVEEIRNRWSNLKDKVEKMSQNEKEIEKPDKILKIVKEILDFNKEIQKRGSEI